MSGGVDSSAAAALLLEQGYDVVGITLKLWPQDCVSRAEDKCCGPAGGHGRPQPSATSWASPITSWTRRPISGAVIRLLRRGIQGRPHAQSLRDVQREPQVRPAHRPRATNSARTTSPPAISPGWRTIRTRRRLAHAAQARPRPAQGPELFSLLAPPGPTGALAFPLGEMTKTDTRERGARQHLKTADKEESMEICFVPDNDYGRFLQQAKLAQQAPGRHRGSCEGRVLGQPRGNRVLHHRPAQGPGHLVAQAALRHGTRRRQQPRRRRRRIGPGAVGIRASNAATGLPLTRRPAAFEATAKIRYHHPGTPATVTPLEHGGAKVKLHTPQRAVTPGQAAVFYQDDLVLGADGSWRETEATRSCSCTARAFPG